MSWFNKTLNSSIGQKLLMGITGLFLISFLVVHVTLNSFIFVNDGGHLFNEGAEFFAHNPVIRTMEIVLFLGLILHIVKGFSLWYQNNNARPVKYAVQNGAANSKWYSRSMGLLGTLILMFLIVHLYHFWIVSRFTDRITGGETTLFDEMRVVFTSPLVVILYVLSMFSLGYHLMHGFQSAFQTLGLNHKKYTPAIKAIGVVFSIIVPFVFALMPLAMHFNLIK
jgi:succinate dehydrogenase / fumarate reductase cytochrome b subunit